MFAYEIEFMDGTTVITRERTFSRAKTLAAYERMQSGAETYRELHVVRGRRRPDLDVRKEMEGN